MKTEAQLQNAVEQYGDMIQKICFLHVKQQADVDDVFQTVFLRYMSAPQFHDAQHEKAWIIKVTMHACHDTFRSWFHKKVITTDDLEAYGIPVEKQDPQLLDTLAALPKQYRDVIYLHYYEGYKIKEIAEILHKKENTIHTWLRRAKKMLQELIGGDEDE